MLYTTLHTNTDCDWMETQVLTRGFQHVEWKVPLHVLIVTSLFIHDFTAFIRLRRYVSFSFLITVANQHRYESCSGFVIQVSGRFFPSKILGNFHPSVLSGAFLVLTLLTNQKLLQINRISKVSLKSIPPSPHNYYQITTGLWDLTQRFFFVIIFEKKFLVCLFLYLFMQEEKVGM